MERSKTVVKIVEVCKVAPPPTTAASDQDSSSSPNSLPLTFFDIPWLRFPPVQRLFFYEFSNLDDHANKNTTSFFHSDILPKLKHSLSLTLQHFLPLAGNLTWPESSYKPIFVYVEGDEAVSLTVAETDADFYRLSGTNEFLEATEYHPLIPNLSVSHERAAALALQITFFPNCGFSIGMTMHHAALDGKSVQLFVKSWARMCRSRGEYYCSSDQLKPLYDRTVIKDPTGLDAIFAKQLRDLDNGPDNRSLIPWSFKQVPSGSVRGTFHLTHANIENLKQYLVKTNEQHHLSTFCVTCAYIWVCLNKAEETYHGSQMSALGFAVDSRSHLVDPVPETYFGNCHVGKVVFADAKRLVGKEGLAVAVKVIGGSISSLEIKGSVLNGAENLVSSFIESFSRSESDEGKARPIIYYIAGSPGFEVYSSDFGWGRPRKTDVVSIDRTRAVSLSETRNGDGVEAELVLKTQHMEAFASFFAKGLESISSNSS
ncbi:phenolic glucoside malonyltransferase 2-like [Humulus lupulus]|uniref:phenolic glucoside malonyltransferase 2-like n=1 Tax=Humulus lupulus TaxID=3486 RepID=UPI002B40A671|nr:phenolic glucoside malonyltransferase 2-like [Humulus lupulus]